MTPPASRVYKCLGFGVFVKRNREIKFPRNGPYWKLMRPQVKKKDIKLYKKKKHGKQCRRAFLDWKGASERPPSL